MKAPTKMTRGPRPLAGKWRSRAALTIGLLALAAATAKAEESAPFNVDTTGWMSLEHFADKNRRFPPPPPPKVEEPPPPEPSRPLNLPTMPMRGDGPLISIDSTDGEDDDTVRALSAQLLGDAPPIFPPPAPKEKEVEPRRPLNLPVMPKRNGGFNMSVSSTADDDETSHALNAQLLGDAAPIFPEPAPPPPAPVAEPPPPEPSRPLKLAVMPKRDSGYNARVRFTADDDNAAWTLNAQLLGNAAPIFPQPTLPAPVVEPPAPKSVVELTPAPPSRPLNLPIMPGLGLGAYGSLAGTEATDRLSVARLTNFATNPEMALNNVNWMDVKSAMANLAKDSANGGNQPLNVRLARMPDAGVVPIPGGPATKKRTAAKTKTPDQPAAATAATTKALTPDACAALTTLRKQQLAAIEGDRQTLTALQAAIAELGLDNKLNFMAGSNSILNAKPDTPKPLMSTPSAAPPPTKNTSP